LKEKESTPRGENTAKAKISPEGKRKQVIERVASEIITHLINREFQKGSVEEQILTRLTQEYGEPLMLGQESVSGRFVFHVIDQETGAKARTIDQDESTRLAQKMVDITRELVDKTML